jgi:hypothetical protein
MARDTLTPEARAALRYLSPRRTWTPAPADLVDALRALRRLPHGTLLVGTEGRVLAVAHEGTRTPRALPYAVDEVTGAHTGRTAPILDDRRGPRPLPLGTRPATCAREGCDQPRAPHHNAIYCGDRCRRLVAWASDNERRRPHRRSA